LNFASAESRLFMIEEREPVAKVKPITPVSMIKVANAFSTLESGEMSPKPTVVIVVIVK